MKVLENIESICPTCYLEGKIQKIKADVIEEDDKVFITKKCQVHGSFKELYFGSVTIYRRWMKFKMTGHPVFNVKTSVFNDPTLYSKHLSQTVLTNLVVTNRYNQRYNYCNKPAGETEYVYEPTLDQLKDLMVQTRDQKPIGSKMIQITGGEPTLRKDLFDIIQMAKQVGFTHVQIQSNGLKCSDDVEFCKRLKDEQVNTIYISFNGVTDQTNPLIKQQKQSIENLRKAKVNVVLSPVIHNENFDEAAKIVRFALDNIDIVKGIHFQLNAFCGRTMKLKEMKQKSQYVDYISLIDTIEQEFTGLISRDDFYPVSIISLIGQFVESFNKEPQIVFSPHPGCGGSSFIVLNEGKPLPLTRFLHVESFIDFLDKQSKKKGPLRRLRILSEFVKNIDSFVDYEKAPKGFNLKQIIKDAALIGSPYALRRIHEKSLFIGMMWYQDPWTLNIDRLQRCVIHNTTPEGIVPFCIYNGLGYGEKIQKKYSISSEEWEKQTGYKLKDDFKKVN